MEKRVNYSGRNVYIGIDVHKRTYTFSAYCGGEIMKTATTPSDPESFIKMLKKHFSSAQLFSVYEAGFSGFGLHRELESSGIRNIIINPASLEIASKDKVKTDKRDSVKLAKQLSFGNLLGIYIPTQEEELRRLVTRTREQAMKERSRIGNRIKGRLFQFGYIPFDDDRVMSDKLLREYESLDLPNELTYCLGQLIQQWRFLNKQIKDIKCPMKEQSFEDSYKEAIYQSIPGVGDVSARTLANELGDLSIRFKNQKSLFQFVGLTPSEHSSGDRKILGHIDRQGSARLRRILVECAWRAIKVDPALEESYTSISSRRGGKRAIVAISRKLLGRMRSCFVNKCEYRLGVCA